MSWVLKGFAFFNILLRCLIQIWERSWNDERYGGRWGLSIHSVYICGNYCAYLVILILFPPPCLFAGNLDESDYHMAKWWPCCTGRPPVSSWWLVPVWRWAVLFITVETWLWYTSPQPFVTFMFKEQPRYSYLVQHKIKLEFKKNTFLNLI